MQAPVLSVTQQAPQLGRPTGQRSCGPGLNQSIDQGRPGPASTGSRRQGRSLLPDCLVHVVTAAHVVGGVPEGRARLSPRAPLTFISGPSAPSDIERQGSRRYTAPAR